MVKIVRNPNDPRYIFLVPQEDTDTTQLAALEKHMNKIPQYMLLPTFNGIPEPQVFLDKFRGKDGNWVYYCSAGLWREVFLFFQEKKWSLDATCVDNEFKYTKFGMSKDEFKEYVRGWGLNLDPYDYQLDAAWLILRYNLSLSELATRAGKTLIAYIVFRTAKELLGANKILMIVPSIHLVKQGVKDLRSYQEYFNTEQIWAGGEEVSMADLTIGTFQSLVRRADPRYKNYNPDFFNDYDIVCVDEAHKAPCKSIKTILALEAFKRVKIRFGFTGTLPKPKTIEWLACQAILGPKIQEISSRELIEGGFLADPIIKQFRINYEAGSYDSITTKCAEYLLSNYIKDKKGNRILRPMAEREFTMVHDKQLPTALTSSRKLLEDDEYQQYLLSMINKSSKTLNLEQMVAMFSANRIELMDRLVTNLNKNVIIFAHNTEYIKYLEEHFTTKFPDRKVYKIIGATNLKKRQATIDKMTESNNCILIGSFGVISTGLTMRNVDYAIFAQSFKSCIVNLQSIGRGLLRTNEKAEFYVYDIIDEFPTKKLHNQGLEKIKIYKQQQFKHFIENVGPVPFRMVKLSQA